MSNAIRPVILFSLPRSGSTLLQRILGAHSQIATSSEPWVLIPLLYALRGDGVYAEYSHRVAAVGVNDFCKELPHGLDDYLVEARNFAVSLYAKAAQRDVRYFLDKTPRYHLLAREVVRVFPEGKFIFLWRHPLAVVASIVETWMKGRWRLFGYSVDLFSGLANLVATYDELSEKGYALRYEDLVTNSENEVRRLCAYLELPFEPKMLLNFTETKLRGRLGDPTGVYQYQMISQEPLDKWKQILASPVRKAWCRSYLRWIGRQRLSLMGYDMSRLISEIDTTPTRLNYLVSDVVDIVYGALYCGIEPQMVIDKIRVFPDWRRMYVHL